MVLSVITTTYNREHLLGNLYDSLLKQDSYDFECLHFCYHQNYHQLVLLGTSSPKKLPAQRSSSQARGLHEALVLPRGGPFEVPHGTQPPSWPHDALIRPVRRLKYKKGTLPQRGEDSRYRCK